MFHRTIEVISPWTDRGMFENVKGGKYRTGNGDDQVMLATMRAVLSRRLPNGVTFNAKISQLFISNDVIEDPVPHMNGVAKIAMSSQEDITINDLKNSFMMMYVNDVSDESVERIVDSVRAKVLEIPGWAIHEKQDKYLNQYFKMVAVLNAENNTAIVVCKKPSIDHWHLMASMIPAYFSQLFKDIPLETSEKEMLHALTMHGSQTWLSKMATLEDFYNIREMKIEQMVGNFERREREAQKEAVENEIVQLRNAIEQNVRQHRDLVNRMDEANVRRNGFVYAISNTDDDHELIEFFKSNKSLDVIEVNGSRITYVVRTYYENFGSNGEDEYETYRSNDRFWYENEPNANKEIFGSVENRKKFLDALIIDKKFKMLMCAVYHLDIRGSIDTTSGYEYPNNCADYVRNYHLDYHHCFGDYRRVIEDYIKRGDTIGAITATIASAKSVNIGESGPTFNPMMAKVFSSTKKCIELPDGKHVTPVQAMAWLEAQEGGTANE